MEEAQAQSSPPGRELLALLQNRVGRNVLRYQQIELFLKLAFRQMSFVAPRPDADATQLPTVSLQGSTLGSLFTEARKRAGFDEENADAIWATFDQVLADRNTLIHGLLHTQQARLATDGGVRTVIAELDEQHARSEIVMQIAEGFSATSMLDLVEHGRLSEEERERLRSALVSACNRSGIEPLGREVRPADEMLAAVVALVRRAEQEHGAPDRGTYLATAGHVVRRHFPGLDYRQLGFDGLRSLVESAGFETWAESTTDTGAQVVRYRGARG